MVIQTLLQRFNLSYPISKTMAPQSGGHTDFRNYCNNISEFEIFSTTIQEIRQDGLITYELETGQTKRCKLINNKWEWEIMSTLNDVNDISFRKIDNNEIFIVTASSIQSKEG